MDRLTSRLRNLWRSQDANLSSLIRGASLVGVLKGLSALFSFGLGIVLGRMLGADVAGAYFLAFTTATIASTVGRVGLDSTVIRYVAGHAAQQNWPLVQSVQRTASAIGIAVSALIAATLYLGADVMSSVLFSDPSLARPFRLMALAVVPLSASVLLSRALQGLSQIRDAVLVFSILPTGLALAATLLLAIRWGLGGAIAAYILAVSIAATFGAIAWRKAMRKRAGSTAFEKVPSPRQDLLRSGLPLLIGALLQLVVQMSGTLMLGIWADNDQVSQFAVAWRTASLLTFALLAVNTFAQPRFADLYARGELTALASTVNQATLLMTAGALPFLLVFLLFPQAVMSAFGSDFVAGAAALQLLAVGQFINVAAGSVGVLLVMSGHERDYRNVQVVAAGAVLVLNVTLIPRFGAAGAASSAAAALIIQNILFSYFVWTRLGILTFVPRRWLRNAKPPHEPRR